MAFNPSQNYAMPFGQATGGTAQAPVPKIQDPFASTGGGAITGAFALPQAPSQAAQPATGFTATLDKEPTRITLRDPFENDNPFASFGGFGINRLSDEEQQQRSNDFINADLSGFFNTGPQAGQGASPAIGQGSLNNSFAKTEQNQAFVRDLLLGNQFAPRFSGSNIGQLLQGLATQPQGLSDQNLAALRRQSSDVISGAADQAALDARNQLAARGFSDSAAAPRIEADIRMGAARDIQSAMENIAIQDELQAQQRQQNALSQYQQMLALEQQAQQQAAQTIGQFQFPFAEGVGGGAAPSVPAYGGVSNYDQYGSPKQVGQFTPQEYGSLGATAIRAANEQRARANATTRNPYQLIQFGGGGY